MEFLVHLTDFAAPSYLSGTYIESQGFLCELTRSLVLRNRHFVHVTSTSVHLEIVGHIQEGGWSPPALKVDLIAVAIECVQCVYVIPCMLLLQPVSS